MASDRKQQIVDEAIATVADIGFKRTNARSVAARLGFRPSNVFYYFKSEQDLVLAMLQQIVATNLSVVNAILQKEEPLTAKDRLRCYFLGNLAWAFQYPSHVTVLLYGISEGQSEPRLLSLVSEALGAGEQKVYNIIAAGIAEKEISLRRELKPQQAAALLHQSLVGQIVRSISDDSASQDVYILGVMALLEAVITSAGSPDEA